MQASAKHSQPRSHFKKLTDRDTNAPPGVDEQQDFFSKLVPVLLVSLTTTLAIVLVVYKEHRWTGSFYTLVTDNRDTVGLIIQIVASALGACQVYALTQPISHALQLYLQDGNAASFGNLRFWISITHGSVQAVRSSLPVGLSAAVIISFIALRVPAALWAGSLTPVSADFLVHQGQIQVPTYPIEDLPWWQGSFRKDADGTASMFLTCTWAITQISNIQQNSEAQSMVSTCPAVDQAGALIGNLATASRTEPRFHPRIDMAGWNYKGRSYGVGASPGIVPVQDLERRSAPIQWISYNETGYDTVVQCQKNTSSAYVIYVGDIYSHPHSLAPSYDRLYQVTGQLPNSIPNVTEYYSLVSNSPYDDAINSFAWSTLSNDNTNMLAVAGTGNHKMFNQTICTVEFIPSVFTVYINATDASINVTKLDVPATDIEPTQQYARAVFYTLEQLARMSSLTVTSSLGHPLTWTYNVLSNETGPGDDAKLTENALKTISDGVTSLMDDLFVANAHSQLLLLHNSTSTPLQVNYAAVTLGSDKYLYTVLITNILILLFILEETIRTKLWTGLASFDVDDVPDMAIAASVGGDSIARACGKDLIVTRERHSSGGRFNHDNNALLGGNTHHAGAGAGTSGVWTTGSQDHLVTSSNTTRRRAKSHGNRSDDRDDNVRFQLRKERKGYALISADGHDHDTDNPIAGSNTNTDAGTDNDYEYDNDDVESGGDGRRNNTSNSSNPKGSRRFVDVEMRSLSSQRSSNQRHSDDNGEYRSLNPSLSDDHDYGDTYHGESHNLEIREGV